MLSAGTGSNARRRISKSQGFRRFIAEMQMRKSSFERAEKAAAQRINDFGKVRILAASENGNISAASPQVVMENTKKNFQNGFLGC